MHFLRSSLLLGLLGMVTACQEKTGTVAEKPDSLVTTEINLPDQKPAPAPTVSDSAQLVDLAKQILQFAKDKDYAKIADHVHPTQGIRFSPYAFVKKDDHKHFTAEEFQEQVTKNLNKKVLWGTSDPMSEPIRRTVEAYFKEFGYDKDYLGAGAYGYNQTMGGSTVMNNLEEMYPKAPHVEVYWVPADEEKAPFEWGALRLVFEKQGDQYYLIAWVHDAWNT